MVGEKRSLKLLSMILPMVLLMQPFTALSPSFFSSTPYPSTPSPSTPSPSNALSPSNIAAVPAQGATSPMVVQTQDYNFRTSTHETSTGGDYIFVTPAGNYSFSTQLPWAMGYLSRWGNKTDFSTYGIRNGDGTFLTPGTFAVHVTQTTITVNSTELNSDASLRGYLACKYDFAQTPEKTSCNYSPVKGVIADFNIAWFTSADYVSVGGGTTGSAAQNGLTSVGNFTHAIVGSQSEASNWRMVLSLNWGDYGPASVQVGPFTYAGSAHNGVLVQFARNTSAVDPSLVQHYEGTGSCTLGSVSSGDVLILVTTKTATPTDTRSTSFSQQAGVSTTGSYGTSYAYIFSGNLPSSGSGDTISQTGGSAPPDGTNSECFEVSGIAATANHVPSNYGNLVSNTPGTSSVSSFTPASSEFVIAIVDGLTCNEDGTFGSGTSGWTVGSFSAGYSQQIDPNGCYHGWLDTSDNIFDEYLTSWGSGSTTAGISNGGDGLCGGCGSVWDEAVAAFPITVTQPLTGTLSSTYGGSTQTVTTSGCSAFPSTFSGDNTQHNIAMLPSCVYTLSIPSGYQWTGSSSGTTCSSGTCSSFGYTYEKSPVTQPINATLVTDEAGGAIQDITLSGCGTNVSNFSGNSADHNVTMAASCSLTAGVPTGYTWMGNATTMPLTPSCPSGSCGVNAVQYLKIIPFIAGFASGISSSGSNYTRVNAVQVTASLRGTTASDLQSNNTLFAGMWATGFSSSVDYRDYGFQAYMKLEGSGTKVLAAEVDRICEGVPPLSGASCGHNNSWVDHLFVSQPTASFSSTDNVTLEMKWSGSTVNWYYQINGGTNSSYASYNMNTFASDANHYFVVGTICCHPAGGSITYRHIAKYFEFGIGSARNIGNTGWKAGIYNPRYNNGSGWTSIAQATSVMGSNAYLDFAVRWGGGDYTGVSVCYADNSSCSLPSDDITFSSSTTTLSDGTRLWG